MYEKFLFLIEFLSAIAQLYLWSFLEVLITDWESDSQGHVHGIVAVNPV